MPMKKHRPEQIVALLRQIEVEIANGKSTPQACKGGGVVRWSRRARSMQ
jgi:putative transposase